MQDPDESALERAEAIQEERSARAEYDLETAQTIAEMERTIANQELEIEALKAENERLRAVARRSRDLHIEWMQTEFFDDQTSWSEWVAVYRPDVEKVVAALDATEAK